MTRIPARVVWAALVTAVTGGITQAGPPALRLDHHGDPLPDGARARLGTVRFRQGFTVNVVGYSPDGSRLFVSAPGQDHIGVFDPATGKKLFNVASNVWEPYSVRYSPDGRYLAAAGFSRGGQVFDAATGKEVFKVEAWAWGVAWSADGKLLAAGGQKAFRVVDVATRAVRLAVTDNPTDVYDLSFLPDGRLVTLREDGTVTGWDVAAGKPAFD